LFLASYLEVGKRHPLQEYLQQQQQQQQATRKPFLWQGKLKMEVKKLSLISLGNLVC